jgi:hypothetical protein
VVAKCDHLDANQAMSEEIVSIPDEILINKIFIIRGKRVMVDADLAELYGVTTKRLNEQVKRNMMRFPADFMFQLTTDEKEALIQTFDHLIKLKYSTTLPHAFTEHGAVMLASVLNSKKAITVNVQIVRIFSRMREMLLTHKDILLQLEKLERKATRQDADIKLIFKYLKELLSPSSQPMRKIGFRQSKTE